MLLLFANSASSGSSGGPSGGTGETVGSGTAPALIAPLLPRLNAVYLSDLDWITVAELLEYADEGLKRLARHAAVFVEFSNNVEITYGAGVCNLPTNWIDSIHVSVTLSSAPTAPLRLRPASVAELAALDAAWPTTQGQPVRYSHDAQPDSTTIYPAPSVGGSLLFVYHQFPPDVNTSQLNIPMPTCAADYVRYRILAGARARQSEAQMPEMAKHFSERAALYQQIAESYWGVSE